MNEPTPPSAAQVKRYARDGELFYEVDANGNWLQTEMYLTGQTEPVMARRVAFMDSRVRPVVYASDFDTLARQMDGLRNQVANLMNAVNVKQAQIDALMMEFCPGEMSAEQRAEWARNQAPVSKQETDDIRAALAGDRP
jgi:hypothetical protein